MMFVKLKYYYLVLYNSKNSSIEAMHKIDSDDIVRCVAILQASASSQLWTHPLTYLKENETITRKIYIIHGSNTKYEIHGSCHTVRPKFSYSSCALLIWLEFIRSVLFGVVQTYLNQWIELWNVYPIKFICSSHLDQKLVLHIAWFTFMCCVCT